MGTATMGKRTSWVMDLHRAEPRGRVQVGTSLLESVRDRKQLTLPEHVLRLAHTEYEHQFGHSQDYERMQEWPGLSVMEVIGLLADLAERHGAKPTKPRASHGDERNG